MQFLAVGSTVQGPELMMKNCALVKPTIMIRKTPHVPVMRRRPGGYRFDSIFGVASHPEALLFFGGDSQAPSLMEFVD
jgi:hypothetical protein